MYIMQRKPVAWQENVDDCRGKQSHLKIGNLNCGFESHLDDIGHIEDDDTHSGKMVAQSHMRKSNHVPAL